MTQWKRFRLPMQETRVPSLGQEDPLEEGMATCSSILAWEIPWTEEPGGLQPTGSQSQMRLSAQSEHQKYFCELKKTRYPKLIM